MMMKKVLPVLLAGALLAGCSSGTAASSAKASSSAKKEADPSLKSEGVMTYAEFDKAADDGSADVTIEAYVQAKQSWWEDNGVGKATLYTQDPDGAYFIYNMPISEEDYDKLEEGTKIKVKGYKTAWEGEVEVAVDDADAYEIEDGTWVAEAEDITDKLGKDDELKKDANKKVSVKGLEVVSVTQPDSEGGDIYYDVTNGDVTYTFAVESYLMDSSTDTYKSVLGLKAGDKIDVEGFLYNYQGWQLHTTKVTVK